MVVRAVYIDIAADLTTDSFLQVLRRFSSVHDWPRKVFSDGGKQLLGASRELREQINGLDWDKVQRFGRGQEFEIKWKFSPGDAPWYNGVA